MNWESIIVAIIGGVVTLAGYVIVDKREKNKQLDAFKNDVIQTLNNHREEYLKGINEVKSNITDIKTTYVQSQSIIELKIDSLEKKQDKHNSLIERMYKAEEKQAVMEEQMKSVSDKLKGLEDDHK